MTADKENQLLELGKISGVFGVKGWVKVHSYTDPREGIVDYSPWFIKQKGDWREVELVAGKRQGKTVIAKFRDIDDRDQAQLLTGAKIAIHKDQLSEPGEGEYYWRDLEGLRVVNTDGIDLGVISHMMETGANDVMVVKSDQQRLIPFTQGHAVMNVDLEAGVVTVDWDPDF